MGKGDKKTRRGKINNGSYGVTRPRKTYGYVDDEIVEVDVKESKKKK
jgi:30S ribosomal protein S31